MKFFAIWTIAASLGIILSAAYMLMTMQRMFFGTLPERWAALTDVTPRELISLVPLALIVITLGVYPTPMIDTATASMDQVAALVQHGAKRPPVVAAIVPVTASTGASNVPSAGARAIHAPSPTRTSPPATPSSAARVAETESGAPPATLPGHVRRSVTAPDGSGRSPDVGVGLHSGWLSCPHHRPYSLPSV